MSFASWNNFTTYVVGDTVEYSGLIYSAILSNTNIIPPNASSIWALVSSGGTTGPTGPIGPIGPAGASGANAYGVFTYSSSPPHGVDSWYNNTATNFAFSNTGASGNVDWLLSLQTALLGLNEVWIQLTQPSGASQSVKVVSVSPDTNFTYVEYLSPTIPPMWVDGEITNVYYTLAGLNGAEGPTGAGGTVAYFGNFYSTSDQLLSNIGTPLTYTTTADNFGITFSGSQISIPVAGTYSYTFSAQIVGGANETATLYIAKNGSVVSDSASVVEVKNNEAQIMTVNFINNFNAGDFIEVYGSSPSGLTKIDYIPASGSNPASPSIIFTINMVPYAGEAGPTGPTGGLVIDAGLQNKLGIVPTSSALVPSTVNYTGSGGVGTPSSWVPDQSPPIAGGVSGGWRFVKAAGAGGGTAKINWNCYNPYYGLSPPLSPAVPAITKKNLNCVWAVITPQININVQGVVFFNLYTLNTSVSPTSFAFTSRWDYSANNLALPLTTGGLTLQANFKYLIYCYDAPKIVATPSLTTTIANCNGQYPSQVSTELMKDPYDIHTDIPHIGFSAVALTNDPTAPSDPTTVQISAIAFSSTSSAVTAGLDFTVHSIGYRANGGAQTYEYNLLY